MIQNLAVLAAKVSIFYDLPKHFAKYLVSGRKYPVSVASRPEILASGRPWSGNPWQVSGIFREFSEKFHYLSTRKALFTGFSGRAERKKHLPTGSTAPTALRPRATCPTCHSGICHGFLSHRRGLLRGSVIFARPRKWWGASAVVAALWSDKPLHTHCAMAYHLHQCRKLWVQGCLQYYRLPAPYLWP